MADGLDEFFGRRPGRPALIAFDCEVVSDGVNDPFDSVDVRELEGNKMLHRDCRWTRHWGPDGAEYPAKGDRALLLISDAGEPWIVEWTNGA